MARTCLTGTTGKLGGAVLRNIRLFNLLPASDIVISTSSDPISDRWNDLKGEGITIRQASYDNEDAMVRAFDGCERLLLVSTPRIEMDFNKPEFGRGRERHHFAAISAAHKAGVRHIYYTSLAFSPPCSAGVFQAHQRTEEALRMSSDVGYTVIREGLYNESWPLYFGYYKVGVDTRRNIVVAGDGPISWAAIDDLGLATALIITDSLTKYDGLTIQLSGVQPVPLREIATIIGKTTGVELKLKVVSREEYGDYYAREYEMNPAFVEWWATTYESIEQGACRNSDLTLQKLLKEKGRDLKDVQETITCFITQPDTSVSGPP